MSAPAPSKTIESGVSPERLDSWKEIAGYLKRGARTVQRWEREEGLPVHRLVHQKLGSVYAFRSELDAWWRSRGAKLTAASPAAAEPVPAHSIAVLPFADMSRQQDQSYFCEGIAEEIIHALGAIRELRVASRASSFPVPAKGVGIREIGLRLGVRTILEGSVRKMGDRVRIAAELVDAQTGFQLWSELYDRGLNDIFAIQDEIAENVVRALQVTLTGTERAALRRPPTGDVAAYDFYLRGREYYYQYSPTGIEFAVQMFVRAIEIDPDYAPAWAGLADCWCHIYLCSNRSEALRELADWASRRALEMNPQSAQAHASRGLVLSLGGRSGEASTDFDTALRLDAGLFEAHYFHARHCFALGQLEKAASLYEGAMRARDEDYQSPLLVAQIYDDLGRPAKAAAARKRGIERADRHARLHPDDVRALYMSANGLVALGKRERGRRAAERALTRRPDDGLTLYNVGCTFSMLGLVEPALDCLEKAANAGITQKAWYIHDSNLDPLRSNSRFRQLLGKM